MATLTTAAAWYRSGLHVYTGGVGYDGAPCVGRFAFTTDAHGAASLSFRTARMTPDTADNHNQPSTADKFRWIVTQSATGYQRACGGAGWAVQGEPYSCMSGSRALSLLPNSTYYLWIFPQTSAYCLWWIDGVTVTTAGEYGAPSTVQAADGVFGEPLVISLSRSLADVTHSLSVDCAGLHTVLLDHSPQYPSVTWEPALADYAPLLPNSASAQALITAESFCNGSSLGTATCSVTLRIPAGALEPALSPGWVTLQPVNEGDAAGFSCLIAGQSRLQAVFDPAKIDAAPLLGASITGYELEAAGETVSAAPWRSPVLREPEQVRVSLVDSRGLRTVRSFPVSPEPYAPPALSRVRIFRCDGQGAEDENGTAIGFFAALDYSPLAGENSCSLSAALRPLNGSFGPETAMTSELLAILTGQDPDRSCECRITATDGLGRSATALCRLPTRRWAVKFRPDGLGVAFGKAPESVRALELPGDWDIRLGAESLWLRLHPVGSLLLADSAPGEGTWSQIGTVSGAALWRRTA